LNTIVPDLEEIELSSPFFDSKPYLIVYQKHIETTLPLAMFGDGTIKLFRLLAEIVINRGNRLMIDEIDTGIYFKRFKNFWKVILQTAKDNDVQLFMTTHNEECIRYFKEVIDEDLPEFKKDVRNITLVENAKTKEVTAHTYDFEQFEHAINVGNEVRA
jgi:AAA15 family ATPase/GTPase